MKQHITKKQWKELTEEQRKKAGFFYQELMGKRAFVGELPTIGQLIEFLGEENIPRIIPILNGKWRVDANLLDRFEEIELIDALWEAVKYKLNQKQT